MRGGRGYAGLHDSQSREIKEMLMPSHAELAAKLLNDAATFFDNVAMQNPEIGQQMMENAEVYRQVAELVATDPLGEIAVDAPDA